MDSVSVVSYEGRARVGDDGAEVLLRIQDVEDPSWTAVVIDVADSLPRTGEVMITLVDGGLYEEWSGTAVFTKGGDGVLRLLGHEPLTPPVGA